MMHFSTLLACIFAFGLLHASADRVFQGANSRVTVTEQFGFNLQATYTSARTRQLTVMPDFNLRFRVTNIGEFLTIRNPPQPTNRMVTSNYSMSALIPFAYTEPVTETYPGGVLLVGIRETVRLPNGANFTALTTFAQGTTFSIIDNWKVNLTTGDLKLTYRVENWPVTNRTGIYLQIDHSLNFIPRPEAQSFQVQIDRTNWPVDVIDIGPRFPYDVYNFSAFYNASNPSRAEATIYRDRRFKNIAINWIRHAISCNTRTTPDTCTWDELESFKVSGEDVFRNILTAAVRINESAIPLDVTFPFYMAFFVSPQQDYMEWDPSFELLFDAPDDPAATPEESRLIETFAYGAVIGGIVGGVAFVVAVVAVVALRKRIFPYYKKEELAAATTDNEEFDAEENRSKGWTRASAPTSGV